MHLTGLDWSGWLLENPGPSVLWRCLQVEVRSALTTVTAVTWFLEPPTWNILVRDERAALEMGDGWCPGTGFHRHIEGLRYPSSDRQPSLHKMESSEGPDCVCVGGGLF